MKPSVSCLFLSLAAALGPVAAGAQTEQTILETVATAVRQQGQICDKPQAVEHDPEHSEPDQKAWIIRCENATYRVKFIRDTKAEVQRLD